MLARERLHAFAMLGEPDANFVGGLVTPTLSVGAGEELCHAADGRVVAKRRANEKVRQKWWNKLAPRNKASKVAGYGHHSPFLAHHIGTQRVGVQVGERRVFQGGQRSSAELAVSANASKWFEQIRAVAVAMLLVDRRCPSRVLALSGVDEGSKTGQFTIPPALLASDQTKDALCDGLRRVIAEMRPVAVVFVHEVWTRSVLVDEPHPYMRPADDPNRREALYMVCETPTTSEAWMQVFQHRTDGSIELVGGWEETTVATGRFHYLLCRPPAQA